MTNADIGIVVDLDTSGLQRGVGEVKRSLGGLGDFARGAFKTVGLAAAGLGLGIGAIGVTVGKLGVDFNAMKETAHTAFTTMLGSGEAATKMMEDLVKFAADTPFEFNEIAEATKKLLAFGVEAEDITDTLRRVGDISSAIGAPVGEIAELYGKAKVQGRLFAEDINQLTGRGIPIIQELAKQFGISDSEVKQLVEDGKVGFPNLEQAFKDMTSTGGQFAGMMEAQSKTFNGMMSTMMDNVNGLAGELAEPIFEVLKEGLSGVIALMGTPEFKEGITNFAAGVASGVKWAMDTLVPFIREMFSLGSQIIQLIQTGELFEDFGADLADMFGVNADAVYEFVQGIGQAIKFVRNAVLGAGDTFDSVFPKIQAVIKTAWNFIRPILDAIFAALAVFWKEIEPKLKAAWENIQKVTTVVFGAIVQFIQEHSEEIRMILDGAWKIIQGIFQTAWALISGIVKIALDLLAGDFDAAGRDWNEMMRGIWEGIQLIIQGAWQEIQGYVALALNTLGQAIWDKLTEIAGWFNQQFESIIGYLQSLPDQFVQVGAAMIQGIIDGLWQAAGNVNSALWEIIQQAINNALNLFGGGNQSFTGMNFETGALPLLSAGNTANFGGVTINFNGENAPRTAAEAQHSAGLFLDALRAKGYVV